MQLEQVRVAMWLRTAPPPLFNFFLTSYSGNIVVSSKKQFRGSTVTVYGNAGPVYTFV